MPAATGRDVSAGAAAATAARSGHRPPVMRGAGTGRLAPVALLLAPAAVHAQEISGWLAAGALSPLVALGLAVIFGRLRRSWSVAAMHVVLLLVWISLFLLASARLTNDYLIWAPLLVYALHALLLAVLVLRHCLRGRRR